MSIDRPPTSRPRLFFALSARGIAFVWRVSYVLVVFRAMAVETLRVSIEDFIRHRTGRGEPPVTPDPIDALVAV